jgi:hypothetical protein
MPKSLVLSAKLSAKRSPPRYPPVPLYCCSAVAPSPRLALHSSPIQNSKRVFLQYTAVGPMLRPSVVASPCVSAPIPTAQYRSSPSTHRIVPHMLSILCVGSAAPPAPVVFCWSWTNPPSVSPVLYICMLYNNTAQCSSILLYSSDNTAVQQPTQYSIQTLFNQTSAHCTSTVRSY